MLPQSLQARQRRLDHGLCPSCGSFLSQIKTAQEDEDGNVFVALKCVCPVTAFFYPETQSFEIGGKFWYLLGGSRA